MVKSIKKIVIMTDKKITSKRKFTFGKYKGKCIDTIIVVNPKYALWAERNVSYFSLTPE